MLTYNFENKSGTLYEYIYNCIKNDILSGVLKAGEKLPSKRSFARNNGISVVTIQNAYDQLISEGYIYSVEKKGYYVSKFNVTVVPQSQKAHACSIEEPEEKEYEYDLSKNQTSPNNFPFSIWAKLSREIILAKKDELMIKSPSTGIRELRNAIANHLKSFRGMVVNPNQIVIGAGTEYLYGLIVHLIGNDKIYAIENPGYKKLIDIYGQYKIPLVYADIDNEGLTIEGLVHNNAEIAHICPNHHFPTGITMPAGRRYEILSWANEKNGRYIIEDDYDSEFRHNGKPVPTLYSIDGAEKVIYMNTFSKSLTPTIRISYMVLPPHLTEKLYRELSYLSCTVSNFEQYMLAEFINRGYFEKHINRMRLFYLKQRKKVIETIQNSPLGTICKIIDNDSGLHFLLKIKTTLPDCRLMEKLDEAGVCMKALSEYYMSGNGIKQHYFILNYSNIDMERLSDACSKIYECVESIVF